MSREQNPPRRTRYLEAWSILSILNGVNYFKQSSETESFLSWFVQCTIQTISKGIRDYTQTPFPDDFHDLIVKKPLLCIV
jgi:hypothetical protein